MSGCSWFWNLTRQVSFHGHDECVSGVRGDGSCGLELYRGDHLSLSQLFSPFFPAKLNGMRDLILHTRRIVLMICLDKVVFILLGRLGLDMRISILLFFFLIQNTQMVKKKALYSDKTRQSANFRANPRFFLARYSAEFWSPLDGIHFSFAPRGARDRLARLIHCVSNCYGISNKFCTEFPCAWGLQRAHAYGFCPKEGYPEFDIVQWTILQKVNEVRSPRSPRLKSRLGSVLTYYSSFLKKKKKWKGEEDKADRGRGGKTTSGNGQAWHSPSPRGPWRTGKNGGNWLRNHLWCPNDPRG